ncbi:hypothetical protein BKA70DRAFT_470042 [Coprinopsis sp. MPI-PUGE-AT-0042]|nr:hypothetical protein BKA70DRAFT_470042 [Coprinopsis sp. MPI-PUGE-AT-0042]
MLKRFVRKRSKAPLNILLGDSKLPLELIYIIVDQCSTSTVKTLALTCRMLAAYCRPTLFNSIIVDEQQLASRQLKSLLHSSSNIPRHIQTLVLDIFLHFSLSESGKKSERLGGNWVSVLEGKYPNLETLKVALGWEPTLPLPIHSRLANLIFHASNLHTLQLDIQFAHIRLVTARFCPPQVKNLTLYLYEWDLEDPPTINITLPENRVPPKLQSLSMIGEVQEWTLDALLNTNVPLMEHGYLRHIQLPDTFQVLSFPHYNALVQSAFATLECIHLCVDSPLEAFDIASFPSLKMIEARANKPQALRQAMHWLSSMVGKVSLERKQGLTISLIFYCILGGCFCDTQPGPQPSWDHGKHKDHIFGHREAWKEIVNEDSWNNLKLVGGVYAFSDPKYSDTERTPKLLGRYPTEPSTLPADYRSIWNSCTCTGWQY